MPRVELVLYVVDDSDLCDAALANLSRTLRGFERDQVKVAVRNLSKDPLTPADPRFIVVPTLVVESPGKEIIAGDLADEQLEEFLVASGVDRSH